MLLTINYLISSVLLTINYSINSVLLTINYLLHINNSKSGARGVLEVLFVPLGSLLLVEGDELLLQARENRLVATKLHRELSLTLCVGDSGEW